jgi:methionyl-tRNA formyltransferase
MSPIVLAASRLWRPDLAERIEARAGRPCHLINRPEDLTAESLVALAPRYVFFPHWSHRIPAAIFEAHECVVFHMSDLPYGRGGSPLQNLIARGHRETQLCALRCVEAIDAGPVYLRRPLSLLGSAQEIYLRATDLIEEMILEILAGEPQPQPQQGEPVVFPRRRPEEGDLAKLDSLEQIHDYIRMLDADGYPHAFVQVGHFRLEFRRATYQGDRVLADVTIREIE